MGRRYSRFERPEREKDAHRINTDIRTSPVRVIDPDGNQVGVLETRQAVAIAQEFGLDLVEVAPDARPPVCKVMDYGKYKYQQSKKESASKSARVELKTIRLRPNTDDHDLNNKLRNAERFLSKGNKVKLVMRLRGREQAHVDLWLDSMDDILATLDERYEPGIRILNTPNRDGRQITAIVEPHAD